MNLAVTILTLVCFVMVLANLVGVLFSPGKRKKHLISLLLFTLATAFFGFLSAITVPGFIKAKPQGQLTSCKSNLKNIGTALEMYATDNEGDYPRALGALTPNYLKVIPICPSAQKDTYTLTYEVAGIDPDKDGKPVPDAFTYYCEGDHHGKAGTPANYPQYSSYQGLIEK